MIEIKGLRLKSKEALSLTPHNASYPSLNQQLTRQHVTASFNPSQPRSTAVHNKAAANDFTSKVAVFPGARSLANFLAVQRFFARRVRP